MRNVVLINENWQFSKDNATFENLNIPHTWNNLDGQDGGADYLRQKCYYKKSLELKKTDGKVYIEFEGVNHIATVSLNGTLLGEHKGGFSTFRFDVTNVMKDGENLLEVIADNTDGLQVYPQAADFTFFGGIYRDVNVIYVNETHFDLTFHGSKGIYVTPKVDGNNAEIEVESYILGDTAGTEIYFEILNANGEVVASETATANSTQKNTLTIENSTLWNGVHNPYIYTLKAKILKSGEVVDNVCVQFGVRTFSVCPERGFILNGKEYHLHGVSRHQDKFNKGWAIDKADQDFDMELIKEVGATTIRLAHYQHNQYFYDLCDKEGMVLWAEIPFITSFLETDEAKENTLSQMRELVLQNYNHPSIFFWGISNEITIGGETDALLENQKELVKVIHEYDTSRLTTIANVSFVDMESSQNTVTDVVSYNHYFGWYGGKLEENEKWIDEFHAKYPNIPIGISEYGAEGIMTLHSDTPKMRDYSEEYHAVYHEHMLKIFAERPFIWSTHQWNMFDFAADARDEGGVQGRNNKGLVSFDRQTKKDAFFLYKAYWNEKDKFVHITGRRYLDRHNLTSDIKVYSNEDEVVLTVNGKEYPAVKGEKIFVFKGVELALGENTLVAKTKNASDEIKLIGVEKANETYALPEEDNEMSEGAKNWFLDLMKENGTGEMTFDPAFLSIKDTLNDILAHEEGKEVLMQIFQSSGKMVVNDGMLKMVGKMKMEIIMKMAGDKMPEGIDKAINAKLQKIKK